MKNVIFLQKIRKKCKEIQEYVKSIVFCIIKRPRTKGARLKKITLLINRITLWYYLIIKRFVPVPFSVVTTT